MEYSRGFRRRRGSTGIAARSSRADSKSKKRTLTAIIVAPKTLIPQWKQEFDKHASVVPILDELVSKYKAAHTDPEVEQLKTQDRKQQVRQAATGSTQGSGEKAPGKTLTREDMVNLQVTDPDRYWRLYAQGKIKEAYRNKIKK